MMTRVIGYLVSLAPMVVELCIIYFLIKLFQLYEKGEIFSLQNVRYIRNIGLVLLIEQVVSPIYEAVMGLVLTWGNPPGHRYASITLDGTNVGIVLTALLIILISWIMAEACQLHEEQELTI